MSELEALLREHTDNVDEALTGFEGEVSSVKELIAKLQKDVDLIGNRVTPAAARGAAPGDTRRPFGRVQTQAGQDDDPAGATSFLNRRGHHMSMSGDDKKALAAIMRGTVTSAMSIASDPDGGFIVPEEIRAQIESLVLRQSPVRRLARIVDFKTSRTVIPVNLRGTTAGWVGEGEERVETETPALAALMPPGGTVYALPRASEELIDDAIVNLEQFIEENVVDALAEKESQAFISGNGDRKPEGFLAKPPEAGADSVRTLGRIQYIPSGMGDGILTSEFGTTLVKMIFSMKSGYRQAPGTAWLASTDMIARIASIHDADGRLIYVPSLREDVPGTLLGYPVLEAEHMDPVLTGNFPLAFGNWQRGYVIGDRTDLNVLRDPYTTKGQVKWYFRKRVHGAVLNSEAIKVLKIGPN